MSNNSLTPATNVTVVDTLPAGFSYLSASGDISATPSGNTLTLDLGTMAKDSTDTITIVGEVTAAAGDTITNTATVSSDDMDPNRNLPNYTSSVVTTVLRPLAPVGPRRASTSIFRTSRIEAEEKPFGPACIFRA